MALVFLDLFWFCVNFSIDFSSYMKIAVGILFLGCIKSKGHFDISDCVYLGTRYIFPVYFFHFLVFLSVSVSKVL